MQRQIGSIPQKNRFYQAIGFISGAPSSIYLSCQIDSLATLLSTDETARANRFRFDIHRQRFIVARGILRLLLGHYLQTAPHDIEFQYSDRGKPFLAGSKQDCLQFNLSHSQAYALYGFTYNHPIGVDLEYIKNTPDAVKIARRFFSEAESKLIEEAADEERSMQILSALDG